ncbi:M20/M25/M40 family metallo-hydrolase, partial [bacterium]|nr:M20/M25/M40 family metallo-hydrolase [bacterium]
MNEKTLFDRKSLESFIAQKWNDSIIPELCEFIQIPNLSPVFDREWKKNGYMDQAVKLVADWCQNQKIKGLSLKIEELEGRTPLLFIEVAGSGKCSEETILFYGHLDKQPEMEGWDHDKGPWKPVLRADKLYGRGGGDDGYAVYTAVTVIKALQEQGIPHARCVIIIESCEESGSFDLPFYIDSLRNRIGIPDLVVCLDSGCGNYDQLWLTTSLRGIAMGEIRVDLLKEGIHSGNGSGVIASSFRVLRKLLNRIEDVDTGEIKVKDLYAEIPPIRLEQAEKVADVIGSDFANSFPLLDGVETVSSDPIDLILNRTWRPSLSVIAADGLPKPGKAGNVLRPMTSMVISIRL